MNIIHGVKVLYGDFSSLVRREINFYRVKPPTSTLFLTYRCNSRCKTCIMWQRPHSVEIAKEIDLNQWKIIIDKLSDAGIRSTEIFGGNVLLRKKVLIPILEYLHKKNIAVHLPTNQIGLDNDIAEAIVNYVDAVYISIDGVDEEHDNIRGIGGASNVGEASIEKLLRFRKKNNREGGDIRLVCNCTISRFNYNSMEKVVIYAENKGFDEVHFEYVGEFDPKVIKKSQVMGTIPDPHYVKQEQSILADKHESRKIKENIKQIKSKYKRSKISISTVNIETLSEKNLWQGTIPHNKCYVERNEVTIDPYGNMVACPFIKNFVIGSLLEKPLNKIWNNAKHKTFRKSQNYGGLPMCRHCILGVQRNPGVMKSIERIYLTRIKPFIL